MTLCLPHDLLVRGMSKGEAGKGGELVATELRVDQFIDILRNKTMMGEAHYPSQTITLGRKTHHGVPFKLSALHETFWHELVHVILHSMGEDKLNDNERFVEEFSHRLAKAIETARF